MSKRHKHSLAKRLVIDIGGFGLIIAGVLFGWLPGPGGVPLILAGLGLLSLNYIWAEKLMKNFDKKRIEYTDKLLQVDPLTSKLMDGLSVIILAGGIWLVTTQENVFLKGLGVGLAFSGITVLISNKKRLDRVLKRIKKNKRNKI
jgi:hypothetical protein